MAELENEQQEEDYLENLLNSVSGPLPEENTDSEISNNENENIQDLIEGNEDDIPDTDKDFEDNVLDLNEISEDNTEENENLSVMGKEDNAGEESSSYEDDQDDIEQLLNMLDTEGMDEQLNDDEINKIADELEDIPDLSSVEEKPDKKRKKEKRKKKEEKRKEGGFFKKKKKSDKGESENKTLSPDDNEEIIKSVEGSFFEGFDLSELEGLADLDDIEDRTIEKQEEEKTKEEIKAEKEQKKKEKAEKKAEKNKLKKEKKDARKAKKAEKNKIKEQKKKDKPKIPEEKIKLSISSLILIISVIAAVVVVTIFGGRYFWYKSHIDEATQLLIDKKYSEAYDNISGIKIKDKDEGLYRQIKTLMYIEKEYNSYINCIRIGMNNEALDSLLQGVDKYHIYRDDAEEYGVSKQADVIYADIIKALSSTFGLTEEMAKELAGTASSDDYSKKISDIVNSQINSIEAAKNELKKEDKNR